MEFIDAFRSDKIRAMCGFKSATILVFNCNLLAVCKRSNQGGMFNKQIVLQMGLYTRRLSERLITDTIV